MEEYRRIGRRLRSIRESRNDTQADVAELLGVSEAAIRHYEKARSKIAITDLEKIADHYGVSVSYFLGRESEEEMVAAELRSLDDNLANMRKQIETLTQQFGQLVWIPIRGVVPGGTPDFTQEVDAEMTFPVPETMVVMPDKAFALEVRGMSMKELGIHDGDIVVVERELEPREGDVVLLWTYDGIVLREYKTDRGGPYFAAGNERYQALRGTETQIMGVVVYVGRYYRDARKRE